MVKAFRSDIRVIITIFEDVQKLRTTTHVHYKNIFGVRKLNTLMVSCFPIGMVDTIFADVAQPDQARIVAINAHNFLKNGGHVVISIKVSIPYANSPL